MCPDEDPRGLNWSVFHCSVSNKTLLTRSSVFVPASRSSAWSLFIPVVCFFFNSTCVLLESGGIKSVLEDRCLFFTSNWHFPTLLVCFFNRLKTTAGQSLQMWSQIMSSLAELYLKFSLQRNQIRWMSVKWCAEYLQAEEDKSLLKTETNLNQRLCWTGSEHRVASFVSLEWNHPCVRAGAPARFCDGGLHGGRLAGSIWLIAPPWQWATLINGRPELFVRVCALCVVLCVRPPLQNQHVGTRGNSRNFDPRRRRRCRRASVYIRLPRPFLLYEFTQTYICKGVYSRP